AIILITALFFLWGVALNMNSILIPHLKKACQLNNTKSAFIDSASFIAYFLIAFPAGIFMKRFGYKGGTIFGLLLFAIGAFLFYPASVTRSYAFFLAALFIIASGLAFLETEANPYMIVLGDQSTAAQRLNFAQSFNGLGAFLAPVIGGSFILSGKKLSAAKQASMSSGDLNIYLNHEAASVQVPYIIIGVVVLSVAFLLYRTPLPEIVEPENHTVMGDSILKEKNLMFGVLAQFFYVGAQVCISSFFILFAGRVGGLNEKPAAFLLSIALLCFMIGRFVGTALIRFIQPTRLLTIYSLVNMFLLTSAILIQGKFSVYALLGVEFFMSIMFPTIFSLSVRGLGPKTKQGSSLLVMSIVGGAVFPVIMGRVSDASSIQVAYVVPASCFIVVFLFALKNVNVEKLKFSVAANQSL
ncbi:MAG: L-fucose:H+ symporter permease, partial [Bacteroidota bacterium]|nr:L-fucose:H+ symporter permease [Bacteroidota bacterium]